VVSITCVKERDGRLNGKYKVTIKATNAGCTTNRYKISVNGGYVISVGNMNEETAVPDQYTSDITITVTSDSGESFSFPVKAPNTCIEKLTAAPIPNPTPIPTPTPAPTPTPQPNSDCKPTTGLQVGTFSHNPWAKQPYATSLIAAWHPKAIGYKFEVEDGDGKSVKKIITSSNNIWSDGFESNKRYKFRVAATCASGGDQWSEWKEFTTPLSRSESEAIGAMGIVPNPAIERAAIMFSEKLTGEATIQVIDMTGKIVQSSQRDLTGINSVELILEGLQQGIYIVQVKTNTRLAVAKLMVE
jgi:hypothetical protein